MAFTFVIFYCSKIEEIIWVLTHCEAPGSQEDLALPSPLSLLSDSYLGDRETNLNWIPCLDIWCHTDTEICFKVW